MLTTVVTPFSSAPRSHPVARTPANVVDPDPIGLIVIPVVADAQIGHAAGKQGGEKANQDGNTKAA